MKRPLLILCLGLLAGVASADDARMLQLGCAETELDAISWTSPPLPKFTGEDIVVTRGRAGESSYNNHPYIARFDGRFWAMWSVHPTDGNYHGMYVRYATSADGIHWSEPGNVTPIPTGLRYVARGFWIHDGNLLALASRDSGSPLLESNYWAQPDLELQAFEWKAEENRWEFRDVVFDDAINNYPPQRLPSGEWILDRRDHQFNLSFLLGGVESINRWRVADIPNPERRSFNEPSFLVRPDGAIAVHIRDNSGSKRIYRALSRDGGETWSTPVQTDFPDATSKNFNLKLSSGEYVLINNPNPRRRIPLTLAVSSDGIIFDRMAIVTDEPGDTRLPGRDKGPGHSYPHAIEHDGALFVVWSARRDDILLKRVALASIAGLKTGSPCP